MPSGHLWSETGRSEIVPILRNGHPKGTQEHRFVKCTKCGAVGFRRPPSHVVYTWDQRTD